MEGGERQWEPKRNGGKWRKTKKRWGEIQRDGGRWKETERGGSKRRREKSFEPRDGNHATMESNFKEC